MGSPYFYLEPLMALLSLLEPKYNNPAVFALDYALVPEAGFPTQLKETVAAYEFALSLVSGDASRICVAGDSAGATLILSLLLTLAEGEERKKPGLATLLSPWITLRTELHRDNNSDFLSAHALHKYGMQYAATKDNIDNPLVSPGCCTDLAKWRKASPLHGFYVTYGAEEVFCPDIREFIKRLRKAEVDVSVLEEPGAIHAWVIASLFLEDSLKDRITGLKELAKAITANIQSHFDED
jgi:acetyl esterase/lipase